MTRLWTAIALLAGSWLLGLGYLQPPEHLAWGAAVAAAVPLLAHVPVRLPPARELVLAMALLAPSLWLMPFPYKAIPLLLLAGAAAHVVPVPRAWPRALGRGAVATAAVLLAQALAIRAYEAMTARRHELPIPLARVLGYLLPLLGLDAAVDGASLAIRSVQQTLRIPATWELLLDPATVCFLAGGLAALALASGGAQRGGTRAAALRPAASLLAVACLWAPARAGLLVAIILQRTLRADAAAAPNVGSVFVNAWWQILLLAGPAILAIRFVLPAWRLQDASSAATLSAQRTVRGIPRLLALPLVAAALAAAVGLHLWVPVGSPRGGRVMVMERHSTWEPTTTPYGTQVYGEAGSYNYAAAYAYCQQFFHMSRLLESEPITADRLRSCDVLLIKTPTARYTRQEVEAVVRYVRDGGSLLLIGDHTNVFNMNTYLNDIARHFGFTFRNDLLFHVGAPYKQPYRPPLVPHPAVQRLGAMHFAVSCSIDPGSSCGSMIIRSVGLWSLPPAYHETNYHPQAEYRPRMQYGAWCQLWGTAFGRGRVMGFADSTLFSNFCVFQPGKAELLVGMLQWLNHHSRWDRPAARAALLVAGLLLAAAALALGIWWGKDFGGVVLVAAGLAGWAAGAWAALAAHRHALPAEKAQRPLPHVVIDRTLSEVPLFLGAFPEGEEGAGYGLLEQWIPRVGNYTSRRSGDEVFWGDGLVIICPTRSVTETYRQQLVRFVASGGRVLVLDSPDVAGSTANSLLWPFGMASRRGLSEQPEGKLRCAFTDKQVPLQTACEITGGQPLAWLADNPVAASSQFGKGRITAVGFAPLFIDANMGFHWLPEPEEQVRDRYEVLYALLRACLPNSPPEPVASTVQGKTP